MCGSYFSGQMPDMSAFKRKREPVVMVNVVPSAAQLVPSDIHNKLSYSIPASRAAVVVVAKAKVVPPFPTPVRLDVIKEFFKGVEPYTVKYGFIEESVPLLV